MDCNFDFCSSECYIAEITTVIDSAALILPQNYVIRPSERWEEADSDQVWSLREWLSWAGVGQQSKAFEEFRPNSNNYRFV